VVAANTSSELPSESSVEKISDRRKAVVENINAVLNQDEKKDIQYAR